MNEHLLTVAEAARMCRISRNAAYKAIERGELPAVRFGKLFRIPRKALEELLDSKAVTIGQNRGDD